MACPSFGSSSEVSLWYAIDPDPSQALPDGSSGGEAFTWYSVPMTGESISSNLTATISEQITSKRSYAGSKLSQGEVTGSFNYECQASQFVYNMLVCVTQADVELSFGAGVAGTSAVNSGITVSGEDVEVDLTGLTPEVFATYSVVISSAEYPFASVSTDLEYIAAGLAEAITYGGAYTATASGEVITIEEAAGDSVAFRSYSKSEFSPGAFINNGSSKKCLTFLKAVRRPDNTYDYYPFRGVQIGSMSLEIQPSSLVSGTCNLMGVKPDAPIEEAAPPAYWSFEDPQGIAPLMSGVDSLKEFYIRSSAGVDTGLTMQSLAISLDNQLRQQPAVGINSPFAAGIASGRFMMTFSGSAYYSSPRIYKDFIADKALSISGNLVDSVGSGFKFSSESAKVTQGGLPMAESPDQDLLINTEFRAFESGDQGTVSLVRLPDGPGTYAWVFARILNDGSIGAYFPGDQSMLYFEDAAATIPATLNGVVGCVLDISQDSALPTRRNLLINSECNAGLASFALKSAFGLEETTMDGFDAAIRVSRVDGEIVYAYNTSAGAAIIGTTYTISFFVSMDDNAGPPIVSNAAGADFSPRIGAAEITINPTVELGPNLYRVSGTFTAVATSSNHGVIKAATGSARSFKVSGFQFETGSESTIYQKIVTGTADLVPGNHAFQQTTGNKPFLRRTPDTGIYWLESETSTSALVATFNTALGANCTVVRAGLTGVTFEENVTIGTTYNIAPQFKFNSDVLIINRALTAAEKALLTQYMSRSVPTLGPNLVTNGTFDTDLTGWINASTGTGSVSWSNGTAVMTGVDPSNRGKILLAAGAPSLSGKNAYVSFDIVSGSANMQLTCIVSKAPALDVFGAIPNGSYSYVRTVGTGGITAGLTGFNVYGNGTRAIDNVSIREIL